MCKYVCEKLCVRICGGGGGGGGGRDDEGAIMVSEVNMEEEEEDAYKEEKQEVPALSEKLRLVVVVTCGALRLSRMEVAYIAARWTPSNPAKRLSSVVAP